MRVTRCLFNSRTALYRVFVSPFEKVDFFSWRSALSISTTRVLNPSPASIPSINRHASMVYRTKTRTDFSEEKRDGPLENDAITDPMIMVVNEENRLDGPFETYKILKSLDRETEMLRMVVAASNTGGPRYAICKVLNIAKERERERELEQARKENAKNKKKTKELELNWAIATNDLSHKLKQLRTFLEKGFKVEVLMAKKKGSRIASREEAGALLNTVRHLVAEIPGAREWKAPEGSLLKVMKLYLSAPVKGSTAWLEAKAALDRLAAEKAAAEAALAEQEGL